ncbi:MAG: TSUP family transporter [Planctomycetota bacterium]
MNTTLTLLMFAAFAAGFIDAIAGGGGLIQLPALMLAFPTIPLPTAFGTNKCSSIFGTLAAIPQYARRVRFDGRFLMAALPAAFALSYGGALLLGNLHMQGKSSKFMKPMILLMLAAVAIYTYTKKTFGEANIADAHKQTRYTRAGIIGGGIGFYDGFFGPGTGSFLIYGLIRYMGFDFLTATAYAKAINAATNLGALAYFIPHSNVMYSIALPMAACNIAGAILGARTAILRGNKFVRILFLTMVVAIIARLGYDVWREMIGA